MRQTFTLILGLLAIIALGSTAQAHSTSYKTQSSFGWASGPPEAYYGQVASSQAGCVPRRVINLFKAKPGRDPLIASARSSSTGQWEIEKDTPTANYYIRVKPRDIGPGNHRHLCRGYRSSTLTFG